MKKFFAMLLICATMIAQIPSYINANAGPVSWNGYDTYEIMSSAQTPIEVVKEDLVFDYSKDEYSYGAVGDVYVKYKLHNTSNEPVKQQILFPFTEALPVLAELNSGNKLINSVGKKLEINFGGKGVNYDILIGDLADMRNKHTFEERVAAIRPTTYEFKNVNPKDAVYVSEINLKADPEKDLYFESSVDRQGMKGVYTEGITGLDFSNDDYALFSTWINKKESKDVKILIAKISEYVMHPDSPKVSFYSDRDRREKIDYPYTMRNTDVKLIDYIKALAEKYAQNNEWLSDIPIKQSQIEYLISEALEKYGDVLDEHAINGCIKSPRELFLAFEIEMYPGENSELVIKYPMTTSMESVRFGGKKFTANYMFSPAENWRNFSDITVSVITGETNPYLIESTLEFEQNGNIYTYKSDKLPEKELSFTLYDKKRVVSPILWPILFFTIFIVMGTLVLMLIKFINRKRKAKSSRRRKANSEQEDINS